MAAKGWSQSCRSVSGIEDTIFKHPEGKIKYNLMK